MRFHFGNNSDLQTQLTGIEGWQEAPALSTKQVQSYGLVVSCIGMFLVSIFLHGAFVPSGFWSTLLILVFTMPVHELIHAISTPTWGFSAHTIIGIQKSKGLLMPYVYYDGEQPLWHFLLTGLAPTIFLTVLPILVVMFIPLSNLYRSGLGFLSFFNIAISGGDLVVMIWLSTRLPLHSHVCQNRWALFWKFAS